MDGMHDLGGRQGFARVRHARDAQVFHAPWEKRVNALLALAVREGIVNMDEYRHAIERMEPRHYLGASYYERMLTGILTLVSFAYYTGPAIPYMGLPRHLLLAFPVFVGATPFFERGKRRFILAGVFLPAMLLVVMMYVLEAWVP